MAVDCEAIWKVIDSDSKEPSTSLPLISFHATTIAIKIKEPPYTPWRDMRNTGSARPFFINISWMVTIRLRTNSPAITRQIPITIIEVVVVDVEFELLRIADKPARPEPSNANITPVHWYILIFLLKIIIANKHEKNILVPFKTSANDIGILIAPASNKREQMQSKRLGKRMYNILFDVIFGMSGLPCRNRK